MKDFETNNNNKNRRLRSHDRLTRLLRTIILFIFLIVAAILMNVLIQSRLEPKAHIEDWQIIRYYDELLNILDEEPEYDIGETGKKYEANIPKQIEEDIQELINSEDKIEIIYYVDSIERKYIRIFKDIYGNSEKLILCSPSSYGIIDNLSLYRNGKNIVIYERTSQYNRNLERYEYDFLTGEEEIWDSYWWKYYNYNNIDLFGVGIRSIHSNRVLENNPNMTLIFDDMDGKQDFKFYYLGEQVGETIVFPGEEIDYFCDNYILDKNNDLYYLYYSVNSSNPWIKFIKVDKVDYICEENVLIENYPEFIGDEIKLPIYSKDDEKYVAMTNLHIEATYGCDWNTSTYVSPNETLDFTVHKTKLVPKNVKKVTFFTKCICYDDNNIQDYFDWYMRIYYEVNGETIYYEERINGLDSFLSIKIPEEVKQKFLEMEVGIDEVDGIIAELKQIYSEYE